MADRHSKLTQARLRELLHYDPETGLFTRLGGTKAGAVVGTNDGQGYIRFGIERRQYRLHRLAWLYMTGSFPVAGDIDHINRVRSDNRWANLRIASRSQNISNGKKRTNNKSGYTGVYWCNRFHKWFAQIKLGGKHINLGGFRTPLDAAKAYDAAAVKLHGAFASLNFPT